MKTYLFSICFVLGLSSVAAQTIFKGKIVYKPVWQGDSAQIAKAKRYVYNKIVMVTDGSLLQETFYEQWNGSLFLQRERISKFGEHEYLRVNRNERRGELHRYPKKKKATPKPNVTVKPTGKKKQIAGMQAEAFEVYNNARPNQKRLVWVSNRFLWNFKEHAYYYIPHPWFYNSMHYLKNRLILGVRLFYGNKGAWVDVMATQVVFGQTKDVFTFPMDFWIGKRLPPPAVEVKDRK